jgi:hypothetical protein
MPTDKKLKGFHIQITQDQRSELEKLPYGTRRMCFSILIDQLIEIVKNNSEGEVLNAISKGEVGLGYCSEHVKVIRKLCEEFEYAVDGDPRAFQTSSAWQNGMAVSNWYEGYVRDKSKEGFTNVAEGTTTKHHRDEPDREPDPDKPHTNQPRAGSLAEASTQEVEEEGESLSQEEGSGGSSKRRGDGGGEATDTNQCLEEEAKG